MVRFGPSGNSKIFYEKGHKSSVEAPKFLRELGLSCYEYSFGRGFTIGVEKAKQIGLEAKNNDILVSVHAPYYINLANPNEETIQKNIGYINKSLDYLKLFGGKKCVIHVGSQTKQTREEALKVLYKQLDEILKSFYQNGYDKDGLYLCPETMGKSQQIGSVDEILEICSKDKCLIPTFDFGHINAVTNGSLKTIEDYRKIILKCFEKLGEFKTKNMHIHFSKIEYTDKGEVKHLTLDDTKYGPEFEPLAKLIKEYNLTPTIISESKEMMMEDALKMKTIFDNI
ncbi:MAG: TIM barrel protein [Clostridiales bacterium]|nr:TIM barrel protein [Candidatus Apopatousia equi]